MNNTTNEGSKLYLYSITSVAILGGLLFGYDTAVISGAEKGLEAFFLSASDFQYNKVMHGITSSSALIGCVLGGALSGIFASRLGRRNSLRLAAVLFFLSALGSYYPEVLFFEYGKPNMDLLIAFNLYRVLGGIGVGLASAVCPMYIAEIAPSNIRGTLVSCNQFAIIFGMLVVYFVNYLIMGDHQNPIILKDAAGVLSVSTESDMWTVQEGWRYMFGSEAFPAALFGMLLFFVPKTPRYLVLVQQEEKAYSILEKINGKAKAREILNDIKATAQEKTEKIFTYGVTVIVIGILLSVFQQAIGINAVLYYAPRIFENAGAEGGGMMQTVIMGVVNIIFTLVAIFTVDRFGRKPLLIIGSIGMAVGAFAVAMCDSMAIKGVLPVLSIIVYAAFFMMSWGPICWVLISEIFPNTIRGKAVAIAVAFQWIFNYIVSSTFPALYDFSPMFAYSLYGIICVAAAIFVWRWVPEEVIRVGERSGVERDGRTDMKARVPVVPELFRAFQVDRGIPRRFLVAGHLERIVAVLRVRVVDAFGNDAGDLNLGSGGGSCREGECSGCGGQRNSGERHLVGFLFAVDFCDCARFFIRGRGDRQKWSASCGPLENNLLESIGCAYRIFPRVSDHFREMVFSLLIVRLG